MSTDWKEIVDLPGEIEDPHYSILSVSSSAISQITFDRAAKEVGIIYHKSPNTTYLFHCENPSEVEEQVKTAPSVGRLIAQLKSEEILQYTGT